MAPAVSRRGSACRSSHEERGLKSVDIVNRLWEDGSRSSHEERGLKFDNYYKKTKEA